MKPIKLLLASLLLPVLLCGQSIKNEKLTIPFIRLPINDLPTEYKTFFVHIDGDPLTVKAFKKHNPSFKLKGYKKFTDAGHFCLHIRLGAYENVMDMDSGITTMSMSMEFKVISYQGEVLFRERCSRKNQARDNLLTNILRQDRLQISEYVQSCWKEQVVPQLTYRFDQEAVYLKNIKDGSVSDFNRAFNIAKEALQASAYHTSTERTLAAVGPALDVWKATAADCTEEEGKLQYACYYNLASVYYCLDDLEKAREYALAAKNVPKGSKEKEVIELLRQIQDAQLYFDNYNLNTRHFSLDLAQAQAPEYDWSESEFLSEEESVNTGYSENAPTGTVITNKNRMLQGKVSYAGSHKYQKQIRFTPVELLEKGGKVKNKDKLKYKPGEIKGFIMNDRYYESINTHNGQRFVERLEEGPISFYKYRDVKTFTTSEPGEGSGDFSTSVTIYYLVKKEGEKSTKKLSGLNLIKYLSDCPQVQEKFQNGEYGNQAGKKEFKFKRPYDKDPDDPDEIRYQAYEEIALSMIRDYNLCVGGNATEEVANPAGFRKN